MANEDTGQNQPIPSSTPAAMWIILLLILFLLILIILMFAALRDPAFQAHSPCSLANNANNANNYSNANYTSAATYTIDDSVEPINMSYSEQPQAMPQIELASTGPNNQLFITGKNFDEGIILYTFDSITKQHRTPSIEANKVISQGSCVFQGLQPSAFTVVNPDSQSFHFDQKNPTPFWSFAPQRNEYKSTEGTLDITVARYKGISLDPVAENEVVTLTIVNDANMKILLTETIEKGATFVTFKQAWSPVKLGPGSYHLFVDGTSNQTIQAVSYLFKIHK